MVKKGQLYSFVTLTKYLGVEWFVGCMFNFQETFRVFAKRCVILLSHQQYLRILVSLPLHEQLLIMF